MLAWSADGALQSQVWSGGQWAAPVAVGKETDGAIVLAALGPTLLLIHKTTGTNGMNVVSYNTAPFNVVAAGTTNATTQYAWSPSEYAVAYYAAGPRLRDHTITVDPILLPYQGVAPFAAATLDGVIHFAHAAADLPLVSTATFSLSGILTPQNPVSYQSKAQGLSNGYGTLAEAGWSLQHPILGLKTAAGTAMAMARIGEELVLLTQEQSGSPLRLSIGSYR